MAAVALACGGGRDRQAQRDTTSAPTPPAALAMPPESIPPARDSSFAWFSGRALSELHDGVSLAQWLAAHRNDTLPRDMGPWCAEAVATMDIEEDRIAVRRAYFYQPVPPADTKRMSERPDLARECILGSIAVEMEAGTSEDSLLSEAGLELRRLFSSARTAPLRYSTERPRLADANGRLLKSDTIRAWDWLPLSDSMTTIQMIDALPSPGADDTTFVAPFLRRFTGCEADLSPLIEAGEQRLADTRDNQLAMVIHYMVANALADGLQHSRSDTAAVRRAISHYRQALALESTPPSPHSRRARWILWRLQAGLLSGIQTYNLECGDD